MSLEDLYPRVTEAIERAEAHLAAGRSADARAAYLEVSTIEEEIANELAAHTSQGAIARCGAVRAAVDAEQHLRALELTVRYLADPSLPADDRAELKALAAEADANGMLLDR